MKTIKGDLLALAEDGKFDVIVHGCNCHCTMGSGIAGTIRRDYPEAYAADCLTTPGDRHKLGTATHVLVNGKKGSQFFIINAYTQYNFNGPGEKIDVFEYDAFQRLLDTWADSPLAEARFGFPMIGMGLAGGDKVRIKKMIRAFDKKISKRGGTVTLVEFAPGK